MIIKINSSFQQFVLEFENEEDFKKIHEQIIEAITDESNTKGVFYEKEITSQFFPSLMLKKCVIEIQKGSSTISPFISTH